MLNVTIIQTEVTEYEEYVLRNIYLYMGSVSLICSLFISFPVFLMPSFRQSSVMSMVGWMCTCDAFFTLKYLTWAIIDWIGLKKVPEQDTCLGLYLSGQFFAVATLSWNACIGYDTFSQAKAEWDGRAYVRNYAFIYRCHIFVWSLSIATTLPVYFLKHNFGTTPHGPCWVTDDNPSQLLFFIPILFWLSGSIWALLYVLNQNRQRHGMNINYSTFPRLLKSVIASFCVWLFPLMVRIVAYITGHPSSWVIYANAFSYSCQGFSNFCVWIGNVCGGIQHQNEDGENNGKVIFSRRRRASWQESYDRLMYRRFSNNDHRILHNVVNG